MDRLALVLWSACLLAGCDEPSRPAARAAAPKPKPKPAERPDLPAPKVVDIAAGFQHVCVATADGYAYCWGNNDNGELGDGTRERRTRPQQVKDPDGTGVLSGVVQIETAHLQTCAVTDVGTAYCWGKNERGLLGNGGTIDSELPTAVVGPNSSPRLEGVVQIAPGAATTCAVTRAGEVYCWGDSKVLGVPYDALGVEQLRYRALRPVRVRGLDGAPALTGAVRVIVGTGVGCALLQDTTAACWGTYGYHGNSKVPADFWVSTPWLPVRVGGLNLLRGVRQLSSFEQYACAVDAAGRVHCWGDGYPAGQLGTGQKLWSAVEPVTVVGPNGDGVFENAAGVATGRWHTCAWTRGDGSVFCWGSNGAGALGDGTQTDRLLPAPIPGLTDVRKVDLAAAFGCALLENGLVTCWGANEEGQLGDGTRTDRLRPVAVRW